MKRAMPKASPSELLKAHQDYISNARAGGARILTYSTPCCNGSLDTTVPKSSETWDSLTSCPYCDQLYMKVCRRDVVTATLLPFTVGPEPIQTQHVGPHITCVACGAVTNSIASPLCDDCAATGLLAKYLEGRS